MEGGMDGSYLKMDLKGIFSKKMKNGKYLIKRKKKEFQAAKFQYLAVR